MSEESEVVDRGDMVLGEVAPPTEALVEEVVVEAEAVEVEAEAEAPVRDDKGKFIPKDRFDEAVRKERAEKDQMSQRLQELEQREQQRATAVDLEGAAKQVKALVKEHTSLLADGDLDDASNMMEQILTLQANITDHRTATAANNAKDQAKQEIHYDTLVSRLEAEYPAIDPDNADFDNDAVRKIQALMTGFIQTENASPAKALQEAIGTILGSPASKDNPALQDEGLRRKEAAVAKAIDASAKQPASTKEIGLDSDKVGGPLDATAIMKLSYDEFEKLPDTKLAEMRGDYIN